MNDRNSRIETILRIGLMLVLLLNACGPSRSNTKPIISTTNQASTKTPDVPRTLPTVTPEYFKPPVYQVPDQTYPTPVQSAVNLPPQPAEAPVVFSITASPALVTFGNSVTFDVKVRNNTTQPLANLTYIDPLEQGLEFTPGSLNAISFDAASQQVSYAIATLAAGQESSFSYKVRVTEYNLGDLNGELWLHSVSLKDQGNLALNTQASMIVGSAVQGQSSRVATIAQKGGWASLGNLSVYMQSGSLKQDSVLVASPMTQSSKGPAMQFKLQALETGKLIGDAQGDLAEQKAAIGQESESKFAKPAVLQVKMDSVINLADVPAGLEPFVATYNEKYQVWIKVPIVKTDYGDNTLTVEASHFSTWGAGLGASMPQNATGALLFDQPYTSLFTGAARYSVPIWTPAGRAGMTPSISLSYSSSTVDGVLGDVQAPWVGEGWNIDSTEIVRKITTNDNGYGYGNSFSLTINGAMYELIRDTYMPDRFYVKDSAFLYIELHNRAIGNAGDVPNTTGEWWEVVTTDGTRYRLGWNPDSEQVALMYGYACSTGNPCIVPDGAYASSGYAGDAENLVARRWRLDKVTDSNSNTMIYTYTESHPSENLDVPPYEPSSYLHTISYTGSDIDDSQPGYQVVFGLGDRGEIGGDVPKDFNIWDLVDTQYLKSITVYCLACPGLSTTPIRTYDLGYSLSNQPNVNGTMVLSSVAVTGANTGTGGYTENGILVPTTQSAIVHFTYDDKANRASGNGDQFFYPRLITIENGYGAILTYTYGTDGRPNTSWYDYRVSKVDVDSGLGKAASRSYAYTDPVYNGIWNNPNLGGMVGYTSVTETSLDYNNGDAAILDTTHKFGTSDPDIGHELSAESSTGVGSNKVVWSKTVNTYITDNTKSTSPAWNYRYLGRVESYLHGNNDDPDTPSLTNITMYYNDPATGNLLLQSDYIGSNLYRKTYYEYSTNTSPDVYILNKVSRKLLVDANNQIFGDAYYYYDDTDPNTLISKGNLVLTQTRTGESDQVVNSQTIFDGYGNPIESRLYKSFGNLGVSPIGSYQSTENVYDSIFHTYPISRVNALGQTTNTSYFYTLGLPYEVKDPNYTEENNNWQTTTLYDGLGRTLSMQAPGMPADQPGVIYQYPQPINGQVAAPYSILMQILDTSAGVYRSIWGIYNGLGRILQNQVYDVDRAQVQVTDTRYDPQGLVYRQSLPHNENLLGGNYLPPSWGSLSYSTQEYDAQGRLTDSITPGGLETLTSYDGLTTTLTDPNGNQKSQTADALGRMVQIGEFSGSTLYATTQYTFDVADHMIQTTDAQGNVSSITYNMLGQKISVDDPDMGVWTYKYEPRGNLVQQTDAVQQQLSFNYDDLGRMIEKSDTTNDPSLSLAKYFYDGIIPDNGILPANADMNPGQVGVRTYMEDQSGATAWQFSNYGRTVTTTQHIGPALGGVTKTFTTVSDWMGRPLRSINPDETLTYNYDALGRPANFSSNAYPDIDLASLTYDELGQLATMNLGQAGNGSVATVQNTYDSNQRLLTRTAGTNNPTYDNLMSFSYSYDDNGNITSLIDYALSETSVYKYDSLNRLVSADVYPGTSVTQAPDSFTYRRNYEYDKIGDLLQVGNYGTGTGLAGLMGGRPLAEPIKPALPPGSYQNASVVNQPQNVKSLDEDPKACLAYDDFNRENGSLGSTLGSGPSEETCTVRSWSSMNWSISNNSAVSAQGAELWNSDAAAFNNNGIYGWSAYGNNIVTNDNSSLKVTYVNDPNGAHEYLHSPYDLSDNLIPGNWYALRMDTKVKPGDSVNVNFYRGSTLAGSFTETNSNWTTHVILVQAGSAENSIRIGHMQAGEIIWIDNLSLKPINLASIDVASANVEAEATVTQQAGTQTWLITNLDNGANPANYLFAYITDTTLYLNKVVNGVVTNLIAQSITYVAGAKIKIRTDNTSGNLHVSVFYNDVQIGSEQTIADASLKTSTIVGMFSSTFNPPPAPTPTPVPAANSLDNLLVWDNTSPTPTPISTATQTPSSTFTPSRTPTLTPTGTLTPTNTPTLTSTPAPTNTRPPTFTVTPYTITPTRSKTPTRTNTLLPSFTPTTTPGMNLMGYWTFDTLNGSSAPDSSFDGGHPGTLNGGIQQINIGKIGRSIRFDGVDDYVNIPYSSHLASSGSFTVVAWVKPETIPPGRNTRLFDRNGVYALRFNSHGFIEFNVSGVTPAQVTGPALPLDEWSLVAGAYDTRSKQLRIYVNGELVASATTTGSRASNSNPMVLGSSSSSERFQGQLDEVRFYNTLLSDEQHRNLYTQPLVTPATFTPTTTPATSTPVNTASRTPTSTHTPTRTQTGTKTPTGWAPTPRALILASGATFNINLNKTIPENGTPAPCSDGGDGVAYSVTNLANTYAILEVTPSDNCLHVGDEVLLINMKGTSSSIANVGHYEFLHVAILNGDKVYFDKPKVLLYGDNEYDDSNIGIGDEQQRVVLQRVPNYNNMVINGTLTANAWDGYKFGIIAFRASALSGSGTILGDALGYKGGHGGYAPGYQGVGGESIGLLDLNVGGGHHGNIAGGGGYGSPGYTATTGGTIYGDLDLARVFLGSGGGGSDGDPGDSGGRGGGIILIAVDSIGTEGRNWSGTISSKGHDGTSQSGAGSGGSIRLDGDILNIDGDMNAIGGNYGNTSRGGGVGRIAVYYSANASSINASPQAGFFHVSLTPTPTLTATPVSLITPVPGSTGTDGNLQINGGDTLNLSINNGVTGYNCADGGPGVSYSLVDLASWYAVADNALGYDCLTPGDEILLINMKGSITSTANVGRYEFLHVSGVIGDKVYFTTPKVNFYGENAYDDSNIGSGDGQQHVVLQRMPNYNNVVVNGTLTANAWNGNKYGIIAFRVKGTLTGSGTILGDSLGFRGGSGGAENGGPGGRGESYGSGPEGGPNLGGGDNGNWGGGGGYGSRGYTSTTGGMTYGDLDLTSVFLGSGGGGSNGATGSSTDPGHAGGRGGGIILISANMIGGSSDTWTGMISAKGHDGDSTGYSGGGSGGSIRIEADTLTISGSGAVTGLGGSYGSTYRGGGVGRVAIFYHDQYTGSFNPAPNYLAKTDLIFSDDFESGDLAKWSSATTDNGDLAVSTAIPANGSGHGLQAVINDTTDLYVQDDTPSTETNYQANFDFDPNSVNMSTSDILDLFTGLSSSTSVFKIQLNKAESGQYQVRIEALDDSSQWVDSAWQDLTNAAGWNRLKIEFLPAADSGKMTLWIGDYLMQSLDDLNNGNAQVDSVRLGAMGVDAATSGTLYFDNFASQRLLVDSIFSDSFETTISSATPSPWSAVSGDGEQIGISPSGVYWGSNGLAVAITATPDVYVEDDTPLSEDQYRARFYVNPSGVTLASGDILDLFNGYSDSDTNVFHLQLQQASGIYQVSFGALTGSGSGTWKDSTWYNLNNSWNAIEIEYRAANATGEMSLWLNGTLVKTLVAIDNNSRTVDFVRLGAIGADSGTGGTLYFDDFASRRYSAIGLLADPGAHEPGLSEYRYESQPDATDGQDANINSGSSGTNYGESATLYVGESNASSNKYRSVLQFDLPNIPANATITSAKIILTVSSDYADATRTLHVYRLIRPWAEDQVTWNSASTGNPWTTAGAAGSGDISSEAMGSVSVSSSAAAGDVIQIDITDVDSLREMADGTYPNYGFLLKMDTENNDCHGYASSDSDNPDDRPKLVIEYNTTQDTGDWSDKTYTYGKDKPHAVTAVNTDKAKYDYDDNGNMICRVEDSKTYNQVYNSENRLATVELMNEGKNCSDAMNPNGTTNYANIAAIWNFIYDGDGNRVRQEYSEGTFGEGITVQVTSYFAGGAYELQQTGIVQSDNSIQVPEPLTTSDVRRYYAIGGQTVAMSTYNTATPDTVTLYYFLTDHLGSVVAVLDDSGALVNQQRYYPFGAVRSDVGTIDQTDFGFTGQRNIDAQNNEFDLGLMDYKARFYDDYLNRWTQPDSIIPDGNPQSLNRYAYVLNDPINSTDPSGHANCNSITDPWDQSSCQEMDRAFKISVTDSLTQAGINLTGNWSFDDTLDVYQAVEDVGIRFSETRGKGESSFEAFRSVYKADTTPIVLQKVSDGYCGTIHFDQGGCTQGAYLIQFAPFGLPNWGNGTYSNTRNVVHEFFHAFSAINSGIPSKSMKSDYVNNRSDILLPNSRSTIEYWQFNTAKDPSETFADFGVAWTYNAWNSAYPDANPNVQTPQNWMNSSMEDWLFH